MTKHWMQVKEGRKGPALCAPSLSKTSHPQTYRTFSAYFLAVWCPLYYFILVLTLKVVTHLTYSNSAIQQLKITKHPHLRHHNEPQTMPRHSQLQAE